MKIDIDLVNIDRDKLLLDKYIDDYVSAYNVVDTLLKEDKEEYSKLKRLVNRNKSDSTMYNSRKNIIDTIILLVLSGLISKNVK